MSEREEIDTAIAKLEKIEASSTPGDVMSVEMKCNRCGASISTTNVAEAIKWDVSHDEVCPALAEEA